MKWPPSTIFPSLLLCSLAVHPLAEDADQRNGEQPLPSRCYDDEGIPQRCIPDFTNAAFGADVEATNTCGQHGPAEFCLQKDFPGAKRTCEICNAGIWKYAHPPAYMTDFTTEDNVTWWQSETMEEGLKHSTQVNITLHLGKSFEISYIRLKFHSSRPQSFAIYKLWKVKDGWVPYQYYSSTCSDTYGTSEESLLTRDNETLALCTAEYSDISPLSGGSIVFSTLEERPGAFDFENNPNLQKWVTATDIGITLDRVNTFGDEIFMDPLVLKSYYYGISDFTVGGRCRCNGHASECVAPSTPDHPSRLVCQCEHHTAGVDCEECEPLYNDRRWARATAIDANECLPCNCHGKSNKCFFDIELYDRTGHGGHCLDCKDNTEGPRCEKCKAFHYRGEDSECVSCSCDPVGSHEQQCNEKGQCPCKPGVGGRRCEKCAPNYYDMSVRGCRSCGCHDAGVDSDADSCDPVLGVCPCKDKVEGKRCDRCKKGHFDLQETNEFGCIPCFCFGHSDVCDSASGQYRKIIETTFDQDDESWTAEDHRSIRYPVTYDADLQLIEMKTEDRNVLYFAAPECYLGDQRASYNQYLTFTLRIGAEGARVSVQDVILEGESGLKISVPITSQGNPLPSHRIQNYKFRLHEHPRFDWTPRVSAFDFMKVLSNLTALKIKASYAAEGVGYLDNVILESAFQTPGNYVATWIETCSCPEGHVGPSCERCAPGYQRLGGGDSRFSRCVRCQCHGHADECEPATGRCRCLHNTAGNQCETCAVGFFGNARRGTPSDCRPCICPNQGPCVMLPGGQMACQECPLGYTGHQCDLCIDGYYGDPLGRHGPPRPCRKCDCNGNVDPNAVGNCNTTTGECLKCIYQTAGRHCERCQPGYYGDALATPRGNCRRCTCYLPGTAIQSDRPAAANPCETASGQCQCLPNVIGRRCERCRDGFWNIDSRRGCEACACSRVGSVNQTCDVRTGQCHCQPGVTGRHCDRCMPYHYGFSEDGCTACDCDPTGSLSLQCDTRGQCQCRPNREGKRCNVCKDHKYSRGTVCIDCPPCYNLLAEAIEGFQSKLDQLANLMDEIESHPMPVEDLDFRRKLREVVRKVDDLVDDARRAAIADGSLVGQLHDLRKRIRQIQDTAGKMTERLGEGKEIGRQGERNVTMAEDTIQRILDALNAAREYMDNQGQKAWEAARDRSEKLGQHSERMSQIAREARLLADEQEEDAEVIEELSDDAFNASSEAYRLVREAIDSMNSLSDEVAELEKRVEDMADFEERTKQLAEDANKEAGDAYDRSLDIYTDSRSVAIPVIEVDDMKRDAARITEEARRINAEVKAVSDDNKDTLDKANADIENAHNLLEETVRQQQLTDELLALTDAALAKAHDAIAFGEDVLDDARETLKTLAGFDKEVKASKAKADNALKKVPELRKQIAEAEEKTQEAEDALGNAIQDAVDARDIAHEAQRAAEQASKDADAIRDEADQAREHAGKLRDLAEDLAEQIKDIDKRMRGFEDQAVKDGDVGKVALERANEVQNGAEDATKNARDALKTLEEIMDALGNLDDVDTRLLGDLEKQLAIAEREMKLAELDKRGEGLREARAEQQQWMRDYEDEIEKLKVEVANVEAIRRSLPEQCYRRLKLEP